MQCMMKEICAQCLQPHGIRSPARRAYVFSCFNQDQSALVFRQMGVGDWTRSRGEGAWTRLEILGHLIDSAMNNHQRFVRAMAEGAVTWPGYDQNAMVLVQQFGSANPVQLVGTLESLNHYLARIVSLIPSIGWTRHVRSAVRLR
jgi:hypothetical protein